MTIAAELVAALAGAGLGVPVVPPGGQTTPPAVVVVPADSTIAQGGRWIDWSFDVTVTVPRDATVDQLDRLETLTSSVVVALVAAGYSVGQRLRYVGGDDGVAVDHVDRIVTVTTPGPVICP